MSPFNDDGALKHEGEFAVADRIIDLTAQAIVMWINNAIDKAATIHVTRDYVIQQLFSQLAPELAAILDQVSLPGPTALKLSNALADYRPREVTG